MNEQLTSDRHTSEDQKRIYRLAEELSNQLVDKSMMKKYGTSMVEGMNRDYTKMIEKKYYELKQQFEQMDFNKDTNLSFDEVYAFFSSNPNRKQNIDRNYIERLFFLLDKDKNNLISIEEFVFAYITFEEKLRLKQTSLELLQKDLKESKVKFEEKVEQTKGEKLNKEGVCEHASLSVTLFEAKDLKGNSSLQTRNIYVIFSLGGSKKQTSSFKQEEAPIWNEDFNFPVNKKNEELVIEVYDKGALTGNTLIGSVKIQLSFFDNQMKTENWYPLTLGSTPDDFGSIHLKFRYIYSYNKYYIDQVEKTKDQIIRLQKDLDELKRYQLLFQEPFGIIYSGEVNAIIDNRMFEKSDNLLDYIASTRKSIYILPKNNDKVAMTKRSILFSGPDSVEWPIIAIILLFTSCCLSLLTFFTKADYLNLLTLIGAFIIIMTDTKFDLNANLKKLCYGLIGVSAFDLIWMMMNYGSWANGVYYNSGVHLCTFIVVALNCGVKCCLAYFCYSQDVKITTIKQRGQEEILNKNILGS